MLDDQDGDVARQAFDGFNDPAVLARRDAGRRLVEQQHLGGEPERHGDLYQPLPAIGEGADRAQRLIGEPDPFDEREGLFDRGAVMPGRAPRTAADPAALADGKGHVFENAEAAKQLR